MGFDLPRVTKFFFCMPLRCGALVIGYISMFSALIGTLSSATLIYMVALYVKQNQDKPPQGHTKDDIINNAVRLYIVHALQLAVFLFYFAISLLLVIGAHTNRPRLMRYYYVAGLINLIFNLAVVTVGFVFTGFLATVSQLISCAFMFYFLVVVRSAFLEMEEQTKPRAVEMHIYSPQQTPLVYH